MSSTPKIVDNKRKHLEKPLSATKREEVLLRAARDDIALKKQHMSNMQESQNALIEMAKSMSSSLNTLGKSVSDGLGLLAMALNPNVMQMANNVHNPTPLINQTGTQVFYPNNSQFHHNQQPLHMPCNPYQNLLGMPVCSNQTSAAQTQPQYHGRFSSTNNISSSNGKTYEQL